MVEPSSASDPAPVFGAAPVPDPVPVVRRALSARDRAVLDVELTAWPSTGAKEAAVRERVGLSPVRYYQVLNALLDDEAALAAEPLLVGRLRRLREARRPTSAP